jgi:hypothetical protein
MKYDDLLEITSCFNSTTGEVDRKYIEEIVDRIIATCAAGPWQKGPPPRDGLRHLVMRWGFPFVEKWNRDKNCWQDSNGKIIGSGDPDKHAPINLPEENADEAEDLFSEMAAEIKNYNPREAGEIPTIVCLCGSTRFWREFQRASLRETLAGKIVLSIGAASGTDDEHFGNLPRADYDRVKKQLDELHLRKIDLADEVLILNVGGHIGETTRRELNYAIARDKRVRYLESINLPEE